MDNNFDNLKALFDYIKSMGFFSRLFNWKKVKNMLIDAISDFQKIASNVEHLSDTITELKNLNSGLTKDLEIAKTANINQGNEISNLKSENQDHVGKVNSLTADNASKDTTINNQRDKITSLENELGLLKQKHQQLTDDNNSNVEQVATLKESLNKITERKNQLENDNNLLKQKNEQLTTDNKNYSGDLATNKESLTKVTDRKNELEIELEGLRNSLANLQSERDVLKEQNTELLTEEEGRKQKYESDVAGLNSIRTKIETDREQEKEAAHQKELQRLENLKATWKNHQDTVKQTIKSICTKHTITYIDKVPFKGDPDNTLYISDEYIVFDAKSPKTDDLNNFPSYLQQQAEAAKKYAKQDNVKRWIFFVVPSNTYEALDKYVFNLADYDVFIVTLNSMEPIILSLKKIEEYDFAEQLSPEERENICRVLGKFAHLSKRRIQVDYYFIKQFIELAYNAESDLPQDILEEVKKFEKEGKINPPQERRAKAIAIGELDKEATKIKSDASNQGILVKEETLSEQMNKLPLYDNDSNNGK